jgi:tetratricopeptide (TPR) repeat protein
MQLSHESYRTRWLVLVGMWALAGFVLLSQARTIRDYLMIAGELGLRGAPAASTPLQQAYPAFAADGQTWVRHALALSEGHDVQLRYTTIDNAPTGREVHWNSAWAWTIVGAGHIYQLFTGLPFNSAVEKATVWVTPCTLFLLVIVLSVWATRRAGLAAGVFIIIAMVGSDRIYEGFFPTYVDHHGLLTVSVLGMMLGAVVMGAGWWEDSRQPEASLLPRTPHAARTAAAFSAIAGACGMWVSAASVIPPIALVGAAGLLAIFLNGRATQRAGATFDGRVWQVWGRVGAVASMVFYVLEYFPHHIALRLEANHPVYALAWWGGGELIAWIGAWWVTSQPRRLNWGKLVLPVLAVSVAPAIIVIGRATVFAPLDPFLSRLHNDYIQEFLPIWRILRGYDAKMKLEVLVLDNLPLIAGLATISYKRRECPIVVWFATAAALMFNAMAWLESRWLLNATGAQVCLALVMVTCWTVNCRSLVRWIVTVVVAAALYAPTGVMRSIVRPNAVANRQISPQDANAALCRDIAATLRATQPEGDITVLASPNASTGIGYYGRFKTLGTLYWENAAGLKAAAAIFSASSDAEAAKLIQAHGVTHIAIISQENFIQQYFELLHPNGTAEDLKRCFGIRLFFDKVVPQWLQMIPYKVPDDLKSLNVSVMLFKVNFKQSLPEALYNIAMAQVEMGDVNEADHTLDALLKMAPQAYQALVKKGELLLARHAWPEAADVLLKGIALAPANQRPALYINYAKPFYDAKQYTVAIRFYRTTLAEQRTPEALCYLAWVLATSPDEKIRNGKEALDLAREAVNADPTSPSFLNSLAAALAENGQFSDAVTAADRALANSRLRGEAPGIQQVFADRLAVLKSGKPLRN